uniref:RING-type E3 ubiquitin transferase n=1 Tax=Strix occidentalis caurina TaxID=311401 RepID=A0A8D0EIY6_STROC
MTLQETLTSPLPQLSWAFLALPLLAPEKIRHFACLSWQGKFWGTEEPMEERGSAAKASTSQLPLTGPMETTANCQCPICLGDTENTDYMACLHLFCFTCIQQWARGRDACPLCRQADEDYKEYMVSSSTHRKKSIATIWSRSPQWCYNLSSGCGLQAGGGLLWSSGYMLSGSQTHS